MDRRNFFRSSLWAGVAGWSAAGAAALAEGTDEATGNPQPKKDEESCWLFWDLWHLDRIDNLQHRQGEPQWRPEGTFVDPLMRGLNSWPTVYRCPAAGGWRMLYSALWKPFTLMAADSSDGIHWQPASLDEVKPAGKKLAANHLYTLEGGSGGGVYLDPVAKDGKPFKVFVHQQQDPVYQRALKDTRHRWHEVAKKSGVQKYMTEELTLVSTDGLHWEIDPQGNWGQPDWHPEPPLFGFYNRHLGQQAMTVRPGWGDRRVCVQMQSNGRWSGPELLFHPDALDEGLVQHYGMPVFPYGNGYVGLLWVFHGDSSEPLRGFNQFVGWLDCQLAFSYDGVRFSRGLRQPFIPLNPPGADACGSIQPSYLVEVEDELRIYSASSRALHGMSGDMKPDERNAAIVLHTLRKDGFMYLRSGGNWGRMQSKPLVLRKPQLSMNALCPVGEVRYQLTNVESEPLPGFTFDKCVPLKSGDSTAWPLSWNEQQLESVLGQPLRLEVMLRNGHLYAFRGDFHFLDAQDLWLLKDGQPIDTSRFNF